MDDVYLILIIFIIFGCILQLNNSYNIEPFVSSKPIIWMYWETNKNSNAKGEGKKPAYFELCFETIKKHCSKSFNIIVLDEVTIYKYLPTLRRDLSSKLNISPKTDVLRFELLYKYGGIWLDYDTIVFVDLIEIINKLQKYDFVGFGCHYGHLGDGVCTNGHPNPATWVMASRKKTKLLKLVVTKQNEMLDKYDKSYFDINYFRLGREVLWNAIKTLRTTTNWDYYHWDSKCLERDSVGNKIRNNRSISNEDIDKKCIDKLLFVPIYNTAPGFPKWFRLLTKSQLLHKNMLISKLFRLSLSISN